MRPATVRLVGAMLASLLVSTGCGGPANVTVTGTVLMGGKPIAVGPTGVVQVTLKPEVQAGGEYTTKVGRCDTTGKFEVLDVPPGKYRIGVELLDPTPIEDKFQGVHSVDNTKIIRDIDGKTPVNVDLAQPGS